MFLSVGFIVAVAASLVVVPDANITLFLYEKLTPSTLYFSKYKDKKIWITGASSGIGEEMARQLYSHGAKVILSGRREHELNRVQHSCLTMDNENDESINTSEQNERVQILPFDMTNSDSLSEIVNTAISFFDGIDILVLNAGIGQLSTALDESYDATKLLMDVNFHSPVQLALEVIKQNEWGSYKHTIENTSNNGELQELKEKTQRRGHIVLTSSVASKLPIPLGTSYAASKHAAHGYFTSMRSEYSSWLRIDLPCPGPIKTKFQTKAYNRKKEVDDDDMNDSNDSEVQMSSQRCAHLIIAGMSGPKNLMQETWISKQPTLFFMYLNQFIPSISNWLLGIIGSLRLKAFKAGLPLYKVSSWIKVMKPDKGDN